jgi:8-oxo-dGTP pyrophosphatase MutT (NUDIX family)
MSSRRSGSPDIDIVQVQRLNLRLVQRPWDFAEARRDEIGRYFAEQQKAKPGMWNGRVLLMHDFAIEHDEFRGEFFETDFAAFHAWTQWEFPDTTVKNCFAAGALRSADGAYVLGVMGGHTANAGHVYFPCGTPDPGDVDGVTVDLERSVRREIAEELGLGGDAFAAAPRWTVVFAGPRIALIKPLQAHADAAPLCARVREHLAREAAPELADIRLVRGTADFVPEMPSFVTAYLSHVWDHADEDEKPA